MRSRLSRLIAFIPIAAIYTGLWAIATELVLAPLVDWLISNGVNMPNLLAIALQNPYGLLAVFTVTVLGIEYYRIAKYPTWDDVVFLAWNPYLPNSWWSGIEIRNLKTEAVTDLRAEIFSLQWLNPDGSEPGIGGPIDGSLLPASAYWTKDGEDSIGPVKIGSKSEGRIGLIKRLILDEELKYEFVAHNTGLRGDTFPSEGTRIYIRLFGDYQDTPLPTIIKTVDVSATKDGRWVKVEAVRDNTL